LIRGESRGLSMQQTSSLRRHFARDAPQPFGRSLPLRSHNSLLYNLTSTNASPLPIGEPKRQSQVFLPRRSKQNSDL